MSEPVPPKIGRYQIQSELGRGESGRVYRAFDPIASRLVAVKVWTEGGEDILTRFRHEAAAAGNLRHKNIITVHEYGEHEGLPFLAMEFLEGEDLGRIVASKKPLSLLQKCDIMAQVAEGLDFAHRSGVVHGHVKPANIMVLPDGSVKIMDFGLTKPGPPEQIAGAEVDSRCDIFAYGVVYYQLLTGRHPFEATGEPPPIASLAPDCPEALERVVSRILQKDRALRYQTVQEVQSDTGPILIELRRERAAVLLAKAEQLFKEGQLDRSAGLLWEDSQKQQRMRALLPRIELLLRTGEEQLAARRFTEAVQSFEAALRLDHDNVHIQSRLEQSRSLLDRSRRAAQLLMEARHDFERQDFTSAYKIATEALHHDPQNPEVAETLRKVQAEMERRQRERRTEDPVAKAKGLLALRAYDDAVAMLTALGEEAESPSAVRLLQQIRAEKADFERNQRLRSETASAADLLRHGHFREAVERLNALETDFPENVELAQLHAHAQREMAARERVRAVEDLARDASALAASQQFDRALEGLDKALQHYPNETALIRLIGSIMAAKAERERQQAAQSAHDRCAKLRAEGRLDEAAQVAEAALRQYGTEAGLLELRQDLEKDQEQQRRARPIEAALAEARMFLQQGHPERAIQVARQALAQYPDVSELSRMARVAQEQLDRIQITWTPGKGHMADTGVAEMPAAAADAVQFSITAPPKAAPRSRIMVDVWAHLENRRTEIIELAREASPAVPLQVRSKDPVPVARGTVLVVRLQVEEASVDPLQETILWTGSIGQASFIVKLTDQVCQRVALVRVFAGAMEIARVRFIVEAAETTAAPEMLPVQAGRHRKAFASYAHADRDEVLARIQGMQKAAPSLEVFLDVLSLRSGQDWRARLWKVIPENDIFYLFWSGHAAKSEWVEAEWKCALASRGLGFIDPVPLCPPDSAPPPDELAGKHFNDWTLAFKRGR